MNEIFTCWRKFTLNENIVRGRALERYATELSRRIVNILKEDEVREEIATKNKVSYELIADDLLDDLEWVNSVVIHVNVAEQIDVIGSYEFTRSTTDEYRNESDIIINITIPDNFSDSDFSELIPELKDTLRHELEHSAQPTEMLTQEIPEDDVWDTIASANNYYNSRSETEAHVAGLYKRAKMLNEPAVDVIDNFLTDIYRTGIQSGHDKKEVSNLISRIRENWISYLLMRYPGADIGDYEEYKAFDIEETI